jgi:hypothetical protein
MSDEERGPPVRPQRRFIAQSITALYAAIDKVHQETAARGRVTDETRQELQSELATVTMLLRPYRDQDHVDWEAATVWEDGPEHLVSKMLEGDTDYQRASGVHNAPKEEVKTPAEFELEAIYTAANDMLEIAYDLGLTADAETKQNSEYPDPV